MIHLFKAFDWLHSHNIKAYGVGTEKIHLRIGTTRDNNWLKKLIKMHNAHDKNKIKWKIITKFSGIGIKRQTRLLFDVKKI